MNEKDKRYEGLKVAKKKLASGAVVEYWYDRSTNTRIVGSPGTAEFDQNYVAVTGRKLLNIEPEYQPTGHGDTVNDVWDKFIKSREFNKLSDASKRDLTRHSDVWREDFGDVRIGELKRLQILSVRDTYIETPRTAKHKIQTISRLFAYAIDQGLVEHNPAAKVKVDLEPREQVWQPDDIELFLKSANPWVGAAVVLALLTGQRQEDVLTLRRDQVRDRSITLRQGKTGVVVRLPFDQHPDLEAFLAAWMGFQPESVDGTILTGQRGRAWSGSGFRAEMTKAKLVCQSERIDALAFVDLRRTCTVELALAGLPIRGISQVTGHADSSVLSILQVYLPRSILLSDQGAARTRKRVEIVNDVAFQSDRLSSLADAWVKMTTDSGKLPTAKTDEPPPPADEAQGTRGLKRAGK